MFFTVSDNVFTGFDNAFYCVELFFWQQYEDCTIKKIPKKCGKCGGGANRELNLSSFPKNTNVYGKITSYQSSGKGQQPPDS